MANLECAEELILKATKGNTEAGINPISHPLNYDSNLIVDAEFNVSSAPYFGFDSDTMAVFFQGVTKDCSREDVTSAFANLSGTFVVTPGFITVHLSDALKFQNFSRFGFAIFDSEESCRQARQELESQAAKLKFTIGERKAGKRFIRLLPPLSPQRLQHHISLATELMKALDQEAGITPETDVFEKLTDKPSEYQLDLRVLYLRKVHCFCYFSATVVASDPGFPR